MQTQLNKLKWFLLLLVLCNSSYSSDKTSFISLGFKIGYTFGQNNGFTAGFESSFTRVNIRQGPAYGVTFALDNCSGLLKYHVGAEVSFAGIGLEWGPTLIRQEENYNYGHSIVTFLGLGVMPYYSVTYSSEHPTIKEVGSYLKYPFLVAGEIDLSK